MTNTTRLKGKERKEAKLLATKIPAETGHLPTPTTKHVLATKELLIQAKIIASSTYSIIEVPEIVQRLFEEVIPSRKKCALWFRKVKTESATIEEDDTNQKHEHFIAVLEKAYELLKPKFEMQIHIS